MTSRTAADLTSTWTCDTATKGVGKPATASANNGYWQSHTYDSLGQPSGSTITPAGASAYSFLNTWDTHDRFNVVNYPSTTFAVRHVYTSPGFLSEILEAPCARTRGQPNHQL